VTVRLSSRPVVAAFLALWLLLLTPAASSAEQLAAAEVSTDLAASAEQSQRLPPLRSQPPDPSDPEEAGRPEFLEPDFGAFFKVFGQNLTTNLFVKSTAWQAAAGAAGALAMHPLDDDISDGVRDSADWAGTSGDVLGSPITTAAVTGGLLALVPLTENRKFEAFAFTFAQAYALDTVLLQGLKTVGNRTRPNGEGRAFPSGHTSATFTAATVISHYYGRRWGGLLYTLGAFVAGSRIEKGKHWASDVVAGAALGLIVGRTAIRGTKRSAEQRAARPGAAPAAIGFVMQPVVGRGTAAMYFTRAY
jgi:membrane-associated phospholipid phosphatase